MQVEKTKMNYEQKKTLTIYREIIIALIKQVSKKQKKHL